MRLLTNKIKKFFLDLFFPKNCLGCKQPDTYLCRNCFDKIEISTINLCPFCEKITPPGLICQKCREKYSLDRLIWAIPYFNPLIKNLIKNFKYNYVKELAAPLGRLLIKSLKPFEFELSKENFIIAPIPLHPRRLRERDFNQAELLAKGVAENFSMPLEIEILKRKKFTVPQAKIKNYKNRRENLKDIFEISPEFIKKCVKENQNLLKDKIIILVDDVATTGATLSEAAKVLKRAGAKEVWGLVVAKG